MRRLRRIGRDTPLPAIAFQVGDIEAATQCAPARIAAAASHGRRPTLDRCRCARRCQPSGIHVGCRHKARDSPRSSIRTGAPAFAPTTRQFFRALPGRAPIASPAPSRCARHRNRCRAPRSTRTRARARLALQLQRRSPCATPYAASSDSGGFCRPAITCPFERPCCRDRRHRAHTVTLRPCSARLQRRRTGR